MILIKDRLDVSLFRIPIRIKNSVVTEFMDTYFTFNVSLSEYQKGFAGFENQFKSNAKGKSMMH